MQLQLQLQKSLLDAAEDFSAARCVSLGESSLTDCLTSPTSSHLHLAENVCLYSAHGLISAGADIMAEAPPVYVAYSVEFSD